LLNKKGRENTFFVGFADYFRNVTKYFDKKYFKYLCEILDESKKKIYNIVVYINI